LSIESFIRILSSRKAKFVGMLIERRKELRGMTRVGPGLRSGRLTFGGMVRNEKSIFVMPNELDLGNHVRWVVEKGVLTKEGLLGMAKKTGRRLST